MSTRTLIIRALTLYQPWCWAVASGAKPIENRPWPPYPSLLAPGVETWIALHAGNYYDPTGETFLQERGVILPENESRLKGAVLGFGRLIGSAQNMDHPMYMAGQHGWILDHLTLLQEPILIKGAMKLWALPPGHEAFIRALIPIVPERPQKPKVPLYKKQMTLL